MNIFRWLRIQFQLLALKNQYRIVKNHEILMNENEQHSLAEELRAVADYLHSKINEKKEEL